MESKTSDNFLKSKVIAGLLTTLYLQGNLFSPVIDALISNYDRYNLLNSAILEVEAVSYFAIFSCHSHFFVDVRVHQDWRHQVALHPRSWELRHHPRQDHICPGNDFVLVIEIWMPQPQHDYGDMDVWNRTMSNFRYCWSFFKPAHFRHSRL